MDAKHRRIIEAWTKLSQAPLVPELRLYLADELTPLWLATEADLDHHRMPPPFWAFAWPGGQALARFVLDHPDVVGGRRVLDFAAGCGVAGLAAARAGAATVHAAEIDPLAAAAIGLNAAANGLPLTVLLADPVGDACADIDLVLAGDVFYEKPMSDLVLPWLRGLAGRGVPVLFGDPGRAYLPESGRTELARYAVPTSLELEDRTVRSTGVWRLEALNGAP